MELVKSLHKTFLWSEVKTNLGFESHVNKQTSDKLYLKKILISFVVLRTILVNLN